MQNPTPHPLEWRELTALTQGADLVVERVRLASGGIAIEGAFALPQLARLDQGDQVFAAAFLRSHGSIKDMERLFGVSYPTIKARLARIAGLLDSLDVRLSPSLPGDASPQSGSASEAGRVPARDPGRAAVLDALARGEITADEAITALESDR